MTLSSSCCCCCCCRLSCSWGAPQCLECRDGARTQGQQVSSQAEARAGGGPVGGKTGLQAHADPSTALHLLFWRVRTTRFDRFPTYDCSWLPGLWSPSSRDRQKAILSDGHVSRKACTEHVCGECSWAKGMGELARRHQLSQGHCSRGCGSTWNLGPVGSTGERSAPPVAQEPARNPGCQGTGTRQGESNHRTRGAVSPQSLAFNMTIRKSKELPPLKARRVRLRDQQVIGPKP